MWLNETQSFFQFLQFRKRINLLSLTPISGSYCPVIFDSWTCWNASLPGTVQVQPCPDFPDWQWNPSSKKMFIYNKDL